ncbi:MAG TPA: ParA family protein [Anaerolineae bacterium]|nr:ParA family protein [Anaerolineae bacterium]
MSQIIAVANQKGGVGKTTTVFNVGAVAAAQGYKTLLVDLDPQAALTASLGLQPNRLSKSIYHLLLAKELDPEQVVVRDLRPNLDILPANNDLVRSDVDLAQQIGREYLLQESLFPLKAEYDLILIDNGPTLGMLTVNALTAADQVFVPLVCEYLALRGMGMLIELVRKVREQTNPKLKMLGLIINMYDPSSLHSREVYEEAKRIFGSYVFEPPIPKSARFAEAAAAQRPMAEYDPSHPAVAIYRQVVARIMTPAEEKPTEEKAAEAPLEVA